MKFTLWGKPVKMWRNAGNVKHYEANLWKCETCTTRMCNDLHCSLQSNPMHCRHLDSGVDVWNLFTLQSSGRVVVPYITHHTLWISNCITLQRQVVVLLPPTALACSVTCPQPPAGIGSLESTSTSTLNHLLLIYLHPVTSTYLTPNPSVDL